MMQRRQVIKGLGALGTLGAVATLGGCAAVTGTASKGRVVVVGGGWGGTTAAKYTRLFSNYTVDVTLVEPKRQFVSCPISNLVIGGLRTMTDITHSYDGLVRNHGVRLVHDTVTAIDRDRKQVRLAGGQTLSYDKLIISPGIDMMWDRTPGLQAANTAGQALHAWLPGAETLALRQQLEAMRDGGTYAIVIPLAPYRCPPGPYERICMVAMYFRRHKPRSKVLVLDENPSVASKPGLFTAAWRDLYPNIVEYRSDHRAVAVDGATRTVRFEVHAPVRADVLNVIPTQRAGRLAIDAGLANAGGRWCHTHFLTFESTAAPDIHILGDSIQPAPGMPKSGHMANSHGKIAAAAIVSMFNGWPVDPNPMLTNTCYSFLDERHAVHVASLHRYDTAQRTFLVVDGTAGVSAARNELQTFHTDAWARNIWADMLT
jgi:NADPH-dependent 2,4-dienoyl-CoA reductase/sulfur reductase-like enzyme